MAYFANAQRTIVIKAHRDTIGLVVAASAMAFAIAYGVHSKPDASPPVQAQQDWTGHLAEVAPQSVPQAEVFHSADLVVPNAQLALPVLPSRPPLVRRPCDEPCVKAPVPPRRQVARAEIQGPVRHKQEPSLLSTLNPLNHVPSVIVRPFTYAGDMVSGWVKGL